MPSNEPLPLTVQSNVHDWSVPVPPLTLAVRVFPDVPQAGSGSGSDKPHIGASKTTTAALVVFAHPFASTNVYATTCVPTPAQATSKMPPAEIQPPLNVPPGGATLPERSIVATYSQASAGENVTVGSATTSMSPLVLLVHPLASVNV